MHDFDNILKIEEEYWHMRSRINWINEGDANSKFFHLSVINRRRKNKIVSFVDDNGVIITDCNAILSHVFQYFNIYTTSHLESKRDYHQTVPTSTNSISLI